MEIGVRAYINELALAEACAAARPEHAPLEALLAARHRHDSLANALFCARGLLGMGVRPNLCLGDLGGKLPHDRRRLFFQWTATRGPFIEDDRQAIDQDLFLFGDDEVTDLGLGEAARRILSLFSAAALSPVHSPTSRFASDPLVVVHSLPEEPIAEVPVPNFLESAALAEAIEAERPEPKTWAELLTHARRRFDRLCIGDHCDRFLFRQPYQPHQGKRILELLDVLQRLMEEMGEDGELSAEGRNLHSQFFVGENAWFSDESEPRKQSPGTFTFPDPAGQGTLTCFWHGKIRSDSFRLHFEWPVEPPRERLRVAYIGPHL